MEQHYAVADHSGPERFSPSIFISQQRFGKPKERAIGPTSKNRQGMDML